MSNVDNKPAFDVGKLDGVEKAAILLLSLSEEDAAQILKTARARMDEDWKAYMATELLPGGISGYPYALKALVLWSSNPLYGVTGLRNKIAKDLADPKKLPLIISVDPFINESNAYADYIIPDSLMYESWGWVSAWNGVP